MLASEISGVIANLMKEDRFPEALRICNLALDENMDQPDLLFFAGTCHLELKQYGMAYTLLTRCIEQKPEHIPALFKLALLLRYQGMWGEALGVINGLKKIVPNDLRVDKMRAAVAANCAPPSDTIAMCKAIFKREGARDPGVVVHLALAKLLNEEFGEGFDLLDEGLQTGIDERKFRNFWSLGQTPMWDGTPGQNVVVYGEQGIGDEMMFLSCMKEAVAVCNQVIFDTNKPEMIRIVSRSFPEVLVMYSKPQPASHHDNEVRRWHTECQIDAMIPVGSLPKLFRRDKSNFPAHRGYLKADPSMRREMRRRLDGISGKPKIGLAWRGGVKRTNFYDRYIPPEMFAAFADLPADFISVQYGKEAATEVNWVADNTDLQMAHWQGAIDDIDMLTALIAELDLVISVPQTAVHQAGAVGTEVWCLTQANPSWPFGRTRDNIVWYPETSRQFRQEQMGDWGPVVANVQAELQKRFGVVPSTISIPTTEEVARINAAV